MKQVININFQGRVVPIEVSAFELLKDYTESLNRHFANEEGKDEIINDIESRIGELFQERLKAGATCITDDDVNAIIASMGRPEDFGDAEETSSSSSADQTGTASAGNQYSSQGTTTNKRLFRDENDKIIGGVCSGLANYFNMDPVIVRILFVIIALAFGTGVLAYFIMWMVVPSSTTKAIGSARKKLFRDPDDKLVAGVCSGISHYFGINVWIPRVLFLLPLLSFISRWGNWWGSYDHDFIQVFRVSSPGALIIYIILWAVLPEAFTTAEKLEMKGEKVDMNSIKNSVMEEMKGVQQRAEKFGKEAKTYAEEKSKTMGTELNTAARRSGRSFGDIILLLLKVFSYLVIGFVSIVLVVTLFGLAIASIGIFPLKDFLLRDGWQNILAWGTLIFFIAVPVIGIITWIIRRLAKLKGNRKLVRFSFISLWIIGWICFICLLALVSKDFKTENDIAEQEFALINPTVNRLAFSGPDDILNQNNKKRWLRFKPFTGITEEDTVYVNNVHFRILKSSNDSFRVTLVKLANGSNRQNAETQASLINYLPVQKDSTIQMPVGIAINAKNKFRNQHIIVNVYVPVGKRIKIGQDIWDSHNGRISVGFDNDNDWDNYWGGEERGWDTDEEYVMESDGLYTLDGHPAKEKRNDDYDDENGKVKINDDGIEIRNNGKTIIIDNKGVKIEQSINTLDSLKQNLKEEQQKVKDSLRDAKQKIEEQLKKMNNPSANNYQLQLYSPFGDI